jgi:hypothetical protein
MPPGGLRATPGRNPITLTHKYSLVAGLAYLALAVVGFFRTGLSGGTDMNAMLFGIFMINPFHNVVHFTVGVLWLLGAFVLTAAGAEDLNLALGSFSGVGQRIGFSGLSQRAGRHARDDSR